MGTHKFSGKSFSVCYNCSERAVGCHADCKKYAQFKSKLYDLKKRDRAYKAVDDLVASMQRHGRYGC